MKPLNLKNRSKFSIAIAILTLVTVNALNAQLLLPEGVSHFPESLGPLANSAFYSECLPICSYVNRNNEASINNRNIYVLTLSGLTLNPEPDKLHPDKSASQKIIYPSQALLLSATNSGVFPLWNLNFKDDTASRPTQIMGLFRYHSEYGVYTVMKRNQQGAEAGSILILDSTFHQIALIPNVIADAHDFQLVKMPDDNWEVIIAMAGAPEYFSARDHNYEIAALAFYDHGQSMKKLWQCGPTVQTVDPKEWNSVYCGCKAPAQKDAFDVFHPNSWQAYPWSKDSLLVAVSEKNDNKIRFWWIVDSSGSWVTRDMFRLGCSNDQYNNFSFPAEPDFRMSGGHNFRILGKFKNTLIASYYDDRVCDNASPARGLVLMLDIVEKTCMVLQETMQGSHAIGQGNIQLMRDEPLKPMTPERVLQANRCVDWGGWNKYYNGENQDNMVAQDTENRYWEISVINPANQTILGITLNDLNYHASNKLISNSEYQARAWYNLPVPSSPISCIYDCDSVVLSTKLVHPTWINGAKTASITLPIPEKGKPVTAWVRGKTDDTMLGELWENITLPVK